MYIGSITKRDLLTQCKPHQNNSGILQKTRQHNLVINMEMKISYNSPSNPDYKQQGWRHHDRLFQITVQCDINENIMFWHKIRYTDQRKSKDRNRLTNQYYLILQKETKNYIVNKENLFNKWFWQNGIFTFGRWKLDHYISHCKETNSKSFNAQIYFLKI